MHGLKPNFTQIPNIIFDEWLCDMGYGEIKVLMYIMRRTYGFHRGSDQVSISQIQNGIKGLDKGTGLSREAISKAVQSLEKRDVLIVSREKMINKYSINLTGQDTKLVKQVDHTSQVTRPELVKQVDTQKKGNKVIKRKTAKTSFAGKFSSQGADIIKAFEEVNPACKRYYSNKTQRQACEDLIEIHSLDRVFKVIKVLPKTNNKRYLPKITTPLQLLEKWTSLESGLGAMKDELESKKVKVI